jgi:hypothetical protein
MADPFEILARSSVDLPAIMGQASDLRARRLKEMMLGREMQEQDRMFERKNKLLTTMSRIKAPGSSPQTEGGGPVSGVGGGAGSAPSPTSYARRRSFRDENAPLLQESIGDPEQFAALSQHLDALDAPEREATKRRMEVIGNLALWADTPEKWEQAIDFAEGQGIDLSSYRGKFSPATRQAAIAMAGHTKQYLEQTKPVNMAPGNQLRDPITGALIASVPFAPRALTLGEGQTAVEYQPGGGGDIFSRMISAESGGRQFAADGSTLQSPAGALGIAQVMPGTAPEAAQLAGLPFDESRYRTDPQYNAALGKAYFEKQLQDFGDPALAVAAYNAGPGAVRNAVAKGGADGWINHVPAETQAYVSKVMGGGSRVIAQGPPKKAKQEDAPSGYRWAPNGTLAPIPGGPADPKGAKGSATNRKAEADLRKEFNLRPEVKDFKDVRANYLQVASVARKPKPTPQDDIALVFSYMKMLDPGSVVRTEEYATAQNATGVPDQIRNTYNSLLSGNRLNATQRQGMLRTARSVYEPREATYNRLATEFQGYAKDYGLDPMRIAPRYVPPKKAATAASGGWGKAQVVK